MNFKSLILYFSCIGQTLVSNTDSRAELGGQTLASDWLIGLRVGSQ